jgi:hypothetical protein
MRDAANYIPKLPGAEQLLEEWQATVEALLLVVELNGPTMTRRHRSRRRSASRLWGLWASIGLPLMRCKQPIHSRLGDRYYLFPP